MLTGLLATARELRNPLTVGYSALLVFWLLAGDRLSDAARKDALGRRLIAGLDSLGSATNVALITFAAAMIGSVLWNVGVSRLVRILSARAHHPDWDALIEEAKATVKRFETYQVTTYKAPSGNKPSAFDQRHSVPSPRYAAYLHERVDERERKAAEMSFRVTLAVALVPVAAALGVEGGGCWWWSLSAIPIVWLDVALMKYTTLGDVRRFQLEDLEPRLEQAEKQLESLKAAQLKSGSGEPAGQADTNWSQQIARQQDAVDDLRATVKRLRDDESRRISRLFAFVTGSRSV